MTACGRECICTVRSKYKRDCCAVRSLLKQSRFAVQSWAFSAASTNPLNSG